jgi:hypothetical protein
MSFAISGAKRPEDSKSQPWANVKSACQKRLELLVGASSSRKLYRSVKRLARICNPLASGNDNGFSANAASQRVRINRGLHPMPFASRNCENQVWDSSLS